MNQQEYLSQISNNVRPPKAPKPSLLASPIIKYLLIGVVVIIGIIIFGSVIGGNKKSAKDLSISLKLHLDGTTAEIANFQPYVKSSSLRANGASLNTVLSNADRELTEYIASKYSYKSGSENKKTKSKYEALQQELHEELFKAKINGMLDRIFATKMVTEISLIQTEMQTIYNSASDQSYKDFLKSSYSSLDNLSEQFKNFSEAK
ncbi:hypothetical protein IJS18_00795 [Candidatus Saccharibacteria bacterium]|nr:hypothetical protein [Candidatus Saccharibacteria bacterium]